MRLITIILLLSLTCTHALAQKASSTANINGRKIALFSSQGQCPFKADDPKDASVIKSVKSELSDQDLLQLTAECDQLKLWRKGDQNHYGTFTYTTSVSPKIDLRGKEGLFIKAMCKDLRKLSKHKDKTIKKSLQAHVTKAVKNIAKQKTDSEPLGVVTEDDTGCYAAQVTKYKDDNGNINALFSIYSATVIKGRIIMFYRFADIDPNTTGKVTKRTLATVKATVANHLAANIE